jgi:hypothetical protein
MACFPGLPGFLKWMHWFLQSTRSQSLSCDDEHEHHDEFVSHHAFLREPQVRKVVLAYTLASNVVRHTGHLPDFEIFPKLGTEQNTQR